MCTYAYRYIPTRFAAYVAYQVCRHMYILHPTIITPVYRVGSRRRFSKLDIYSSISLAAAVCRKRVEGWKHFAEKLYETHWYLLVVSSLRGNQPGFKNWLPGVPVHAKGLVAATLLIPTAVIPAAPATMAVTISNDHSRVYSPTEASPTEDY